MSDAPNNEAEETEEVEQVEPAEVLLDATVENVRAFYERQAYPLVHRRDDNPEWIFCYFTGPGPVQVEDYGDGVISVQWNGSTGRMRVTGVSEEGNQMSIDNVRVNVLDPEQAQSDIESKREEEAQEQEGPNEKKD